MYFDAVLYDVATQVGVDADGHPVLVKTAGSPSGRERLRREAAVLERFGHPNVAELLACDETTDSTTLTQRWAGSQTLGGLTPMAADQAAGVLASLAATVADLHDRGLAHGRIDGSHVVVAADGRPILCGLADATDAPDAPAVQAEDVAALGDLLRSAVGTDLEPDPIPDRSRFRPRLRRQRWSGYRARALLNLADQATAEQPEHRPTARQLAASLAATVPGARLPTPSDSAPATGSLLSAPPEPRAAAAMPEAAQSEPPVAAPTVPASGAAAIPDSDEPTSSVETSAGTGALEALDEERWAALWGAGDDHPVRDPLGLRDAEPSRPAPPDEADGTDGADDDAAAPRPDQQEHRTRRLPVKVLAALVGAGLIATGWYGLRHRSADEHSGAQRRPATVRTTPAHQVPLTVGKPAPPATRPPARKAPACSPVRGASADVNHDGCPETVSVQGRVITAGAEQYEVGRPGDDVVVGDWRCDGQVTPAVLRPSTGEVFVFRGWANRSEPLTVAATDTTAGADGLRTEHRGRCDVLVATRPGHAPVEIPATGS